MLAALALIIASPTFTLVETVTRDRYFEVMGSPRGDAFYLIDHFEFGETPRKQIFRKEPKKEPELLESYEDEVWFEGTDSNGKPRLNRGGRSESHTVDSSGPSRRPYYFTKSGSHLDSGVVVQQFGEANITLIGPLRKSIRDYLPAGHIPVSSVAVLTNQPLFVSCDGKDHLITVTSDENNPRDPYTLTLYRWGEEINTLIPEKTFQLPKLEGSEEFHIKALAIASEGKCYIVYESWTLKKPYLYTDVAKQSILYVDIQAQTQQTVVSNEIKGPVSFAADAMPNTDFVDLYVIQSGKFIAVKEWKKARIYRRDE